MTEHSHHVEDNEILKSVISKQGDLELLKKIDSLSLGNAQKQKELQIIDSCIKKEDLEEYKRVREESVLKANQMNNFSHYTAQSNKQSSNPRLQNINNNNTNVVIEENEITEKSKQTWGKEKAQSDLNISGLLKYLRINFDCWIGVSTLYKYPSPGVHDYICNALYSVPDEEIEFYLLQLCTMLVFTEFSTNALERLIMDKCKKSIHFALLVSWFLQSLAVDSKMFDRCENLQNQCEIAVVNSTFVQMGKVLSSQLRLNHSTESASTLSQMISDQLSHSSSSTPTGYTSTTEDDECDIIPSNSFSLSSPSDPPSSLIDDPMINEALRKKERCEYFNHILQFVVELGQVSDRLRAVPIPERGKKLVEYMNKINKKIQPGLYLPLWDASKLHYCIASIVPHESKVLNSRERVPYIILFETLETNVQNSTQDLQDVAAAYVSCIQEILKEPPNHYDDEEIRSSSLNSLQESYRNSPFGIPFEVKKVSIRAKSPFGKLESWDLKSIIVKFGDDCRQEYLAMQLISQFKSIFDKANLPLYLRPYRILINSVSSGLIETITDSISLHQLKRFYLPDNVSIQHHFIRFYGKESDNHQLAVRNFVESLAAYSLLTYILQVKDRHNGNIMITSTGHIIHIDYGFMLSNSPGSLNAENVPFKFTQEYLDVMGGSHSPMFRYFKELLYKGYIELRKNYEKIVLLVEIMSIGSKLPCFHSDNATSALRERFMLNLSDHAVPSFIDNLLFQSYNNWRTHFYDRYQYLTNGILA